MKPEKKSILRQCGIVLLCIVINIVGRYIAYSLQLPLWLDTLGTFLASYYTNVFGGIIAAIPVNIIFGLDNELSMLYVLVGVVLTLCMQVCVKRKHWESFIPAMMSSFALGLVASLVSTPIDILINKGYSGNVWGDALFDMMRFYGDSNIISSFASECFINILDKQISVFVIYIIINIDKIRKGNYDKNKNDKKKIIFSGITGIIAVVALILGLYFRPVQNEGKIENVEILRSADEHHEYEKYINYNEYVKTIYNSRNGLPSSEANAVAQTSDGYIWIGGYAGLCKYDGSRFQYITEGGLSNVTAMLTDKMGRLWIGTNDRGIAIYENGNMTYITKDKGLTANSIKTLFEDKDGIIYVGTTQNLVSIGKDFTVTTVEQAPEGAVSVAVCKGIILGIDSTGNLFCIKDNRLIYNKKSDSEMYSYVSIYADDDVIYVSTTGNDIIEISIDDDGVYTQNNIACGSLNCITRIQKTKEGVVWLSADNGIGYLNEDGTVNVLQCSGFDSSIECMLQDYEGNYWFTSSRFGVMRMCKNAFTNIHESANKEGPVVNAVTGYEGYLYCGTDNGLQIINPNTYEFVNNNLTDFIGNVRVRCLYVDSKNLLWICCYGEPGLVCVNSDGEITSYNESSNKTAGDRFRCMTELQDGTVAVGSSGGITFIKNGVVTGTLTKKDGLKTTQIQSMVQAPDGTLYAGSDGSGIYVIRDERLEDNITEGNGLSSPIILRMVVYEDACFVVTSNSVEVMRNNTVKRINTFPYFNNFDIVIHNDEAWVFTSRGIYVTNVKDLLEDKFNYILYDYSNGLINSITVNSWTYIDENEYLYFCTNAGLEKIAMDSDDIYKGNYKMQISSFMADDNEVQADNGVYSIDATVDKISITPAICNYLLNDLKVYVYVEELDKTPAIKRQSQLDTLVYTNVPSGKYTLYMKILSDMEEKVIQEKTYTIIKKAQMWENTFFTVYLCVVLLWEVSLLTWVVNSLRQTFKRRKELERMKVELEYQVKEQTAEITEQSQKIEMMQWSVIEGMASLIESRDGNTGQHVKNTREYVKLLSEELLRRGMYSNVINEKFVTTITQVAPLHDVGKIKISDVILNKPSKFTPEEFEIMKQHTVMGGEIVTDILGKDADPYMLKMAKEVATYHHEKWDGSGYPEGLSGKNIPLPARIMAVADVFDAIISKRVYKESMSIEEGFSELERCAGTHFDKELVKVFIDIKSEVALYCNSIKENE